MASPFLTYAGVLERAPHLVHVYLPNEASTTGYRFWGAASPNAAYGDPPGSSVGGAGVAALFTVARGDMFRSPTLRRKGLAAIPESRRGTTHAAFDIDDYLVPGTGLPPDEQWLFLRVQEQRYTTGLLAYPGAPEATVTLNGTLAGDTLTIKGVVFQFQAGANALAGKAGTVMDPFLVGLGANDNAAAANLTLALNDNGDVAPVMNLLAPLNTHTFGTNMGAPSAVVRVQPEDLAATLLLGDAAQFSIASSTNVRVTIDATALAQARLVWVVDTTNPVLGPIYLVPPAKSYGLPSPSFTLWGTAPTTACTAGAVPVISQNLASAAPRPLHLVFPVPVTEITIRNLDGASTLLMSFGPDQIMQEILAGQEVLYTSGGAKDVLLSTAAAGCPYSIHGVMHRG